MSNNLFAVLNMSDEEGAPTEKAQQKATQQANKKNKQKREQEQVIPVEQVQKESTKHHNEGQKQKGLTAEPHPKDRQSGTGRGKELRKEGGGRRNWGNYKDDLKEEKYQEKPEEGTQNEQAPQQDAAQNEVQEEKKPEVPPPPPEVTLADYYQARGVNVDQVLKQQEAKPAPKQIDEEALKREKLFVMKTKVDEKRELEQKAPKKQVNQKQGYRSELNSQAQEYLGFTAERNEERREYKGDREYKGNQKDRRGGQGQQNKKPVQQQGVQLDDKDFPAL